MAGPSGKRDVVSAYLFRMPKGRSLCDPRVKRHHRRRPTTEDLLAIGRLRSEALKTRTSIKKHSLDASRHDLHRTLRHPDILSNPTGTLGSGLTVGNNKEPRSTVDVIPKYKHPPF